MSLNKAIKYGKEHRKEYTGAKSVAPSCRNHKGCKWCEDNRTYHNRKQIQKTNEQLKEVKQMSRIIRLIDNETIEISDYRNSGYLFDHNAPSIKDIRKQISNIDDWCIFKETINPFVLYGEKEELQYRIDKAIDYMELKTIVHKTYCLDRDEMKVLLDILRGEDNE